MPMAMSAVVTVSIGLLTTGMFSEILRVSEELRSQEEGMISL
jgi:hypothetical protein